MIAYPVFVCHGHFSQPTETEECYEVIWSNGKSCRKCPLKACYRNGWLKKQVDADNRKIVAKRREQLLRESSHD